MPYDVSNGSAQTLIEVNLDKDPLISTNSSVAKARRILDRQSTLLHSSAYIFGYLMFEIGKQVSNFSLMRLNNGSPPFSSSILIVLVEFTKIFIVSGYIQVQKCRHDIAFQGFSIKFAIPALCYFFTNLLYLYALTLTAPPTWLILIQTRVMFTALIYKVFLGKDITYVQILGCGFIVLSIFLTRISENESGHITISITLIIVSQLSSLLSSIACLSVEILLKNDSRQYSEQQFWLYFWGTLFGLMSFYVTPSKYSVDLIQILKELKQSPDQMLLVLSSILLSSFAGLCVPIIVKRLDSIVKDYLAAMNNILLSYIVFCIFPTEFSINFIYIISLLILITGIVLYERKSYASLKKIFVS